MKTITRQLTWEALTRRAEYRLDHDQLATADSSSTTVGSDWSGTRTLDAAIELMRDGWREGTGRMITGLDAHKTQDREIRPDMPLDMAGFFPCIPAYVAGDDACMFTYEEDIRASRSITLAIPLCYSAFVTPETAQEYARNVAAIVAGLEASGIGVGVLGIDAVRGNRKNNVYAYGVWVRSFDMPLDLARIAFSMHPAMLRRIGFAWRELEPEWVDGGCSSGGYGHCHNITDELVVQCLGHVGEYILLPELSAMEGQSHAAMAQVMRERVEKVIFKQEAQS